MLLIFLKLVQKAVGESDCALCAWRAHSQPLEVTLKVTLKSHVKKYVITPRYNVDLTSRYNVDLTWPKSYNAGFNADITWKL